MQTVLIESPELQATFVPGAGMVCCSLRHDGAELLAQRGGVRAYAERGSTMGIPLLYPWANRLAGFRYGTPPSHVELARTSPLLKLDANGLPIHGAIAGALVWELLERPGERRVSLRAQLRSERAEELAIFPFAHTLELRARIDGATLLIETSLEAREVRFPLEASSFVCECVRMEIDCEHIWSAVEARDPRFDGWFFCGVKTTGIYCRPSCPARTPKRENVRFFASAAAAQSAGFRACKRCRPDATPGSPEWDVRADVVGRAMRLIGDGIVDREGVSGLARRLGYTERHLHRQLAAVVGAGPLALARAQRAQTARILLETTKLPVTDVTFAAGFRSVRQFNATIQEVFATTPSALRERARRHGRAQDSGALSLRLPYRSPLDAEGLVAFLGRRAVPGVEQVLDGAYRRSLRLAHGAGIVELRPGNGYVQARYRLADLRDLGAAMQRSRTLLDLDSDPQSVADVLGRDPLLGPSVERSPGLRLAGTVDGHELAVRAVLGQQVSLSGAATLAARLVERHGEPLERPLGAVTHTFPTAQALAEMDPASLAMPTARRRALLALAAALARGELVIDAGADRAETKRQLLELSGIGAWTAEYIAMRALRDPDAFLASDLGVRHALEQLGLDAHPRSATAIAERWRPYRAYAVAHLWASLHPAPAPLSAVAGISGASRRARRRPEPAPA